MDEKNARTRDVLTRIPGGLFVMTSSFEGKRGGVIVKSVMPVAEEPMLLAVAAWKGHGLEPIVRDSHHFAVSMIDPEDRVLIRRFTGHLSEHSEQFDSVATERLVSTSPVLSRSIIAIDCEVVRHFDIEADHELYIGLVLGAKVCTPDHPLASHNLARQAVNWKPGAQSRRTAARVASSNGTHATPHEESRMRSHDERATKPERARDRS